MGRSTRPMPVPDIRPAAANWPQRIVVVAIALALLGSAWVIDPLAEAGFDAPKRLLTLLAAAVGAAALAWQAQVPRWNELAAPARTILLLVLAAAAGLLLATLLAPQPSSAWPAIRVIALYALFLPLGAAAALDGAAGRKLAWVAAAAVLLNALLSLLQAGGIALPIPLARLGGRFATGALLGNEGYVALACAMLAAACLAAALHARTRNGRLLAIALGLVGIVTILVNRQLTSAVALVAAVLAIAAVHWRARWWLRAGTALALFAVATAAIAPLRALTWAQLPGASVETYQRVTTYRLGAWAAADEMRRQRPLTGFGPGSFAAEAQRQRFSAEVHLGERLQPPPGATAFVYAHQEYLQLAAEAGLPTLGAVLAALGLLLRGCIRLAHRADAVEPLALFGVLVTGSIAALAWFPLQVPLTAVLLLLAAGRAWRLIALAPQAHA